MKKQTSSAGPLTRSQQQLVLDHLRVVDAAAGNLTRAADRREELRSHGYEGLVRAARFFDASVGVPFAAFAAIHVRWAMLRGLRSDRRHVRRLISEETLVAEGRERCCGTSVDPSFGPQPLDAESQVLQSEREHWLRAVVGGAVAGLRAQDRAVVEAHYYGDRDLKSLVRPGASYATIRRRHTGALSRLEKRLPRTSNFVGANMS